MNKFQILFYFDSEEIAVFESKRLDLSTSASLSDIYKWTVYSKKDHTYDSLVFRSMTNREKEHLRSFAQGELRFDQESADFDFKDRHFKLKVAGPEGMPAEFKKEAEAFLLSIPQHH